MTDKHKQYLLEDLDPNNILQETGGGLVLSTGEIKSPTFTSGANGEGWRFDNLGNLEANDGHFRGDITGASGTFSGSISATAGFIGGWTINATELTSTGITLDSANSKIEVGSEITIDGVNKNIVSSNYATGVSGFSIDSDLIEAENLTARGTMKGVTFAYDQISAVGGQLMVSNADVLASDMTALDSSTLTVKGDTTFAVNDILVMKGTTASGIQDEWLRVTAVYPITTNTSATSPGTMADDDTIGTKAWANPDNAKIEDASYASLVGVINTTTLSDYLKATNFGFSIPTSSTISGIKLEIKQKCDSATSSYNSIENEVKILKGGVIGSENKADTVSYIPTSEAYMPYGGASDLWSETWTAEDINNSNFGIVYALTNTNGSFPGNTAYVNHIRITIYYTLGTAGTYTVTRDLAGTYSADNNPIWKAGTPVVKQGVSNGTDTYSGGWLRLIGEGTNSPYYSVFARNGIAYNAFTESVRMGNLNGIGGETTDVYGFFAGDSNNYIKWNGSALTATNIGIVNSFTAGETVTTTTAPVPIYIATSDGDIYNCDDTDSNKLAYTGFAITTATTTNSINVQFSGITEGFTNLNIGSTYYLKTGAESYIDTTQKQTAGTAEINFIGVQASGTDNGKIGQTFTTSTTYNSLNNVKVNLKKNNSPTDNVTIKVYESDKTTLVATSTTTVAGSTITTSFAEYQFDFDDVLLDFSTTYFIEVYRTGSVDATNTYLVKYNDSSSTYAGGEAFRWINSSNSWGNVSYDLVFEVGLKEAYSSGDIAVSAGVNSVKVGRAVSNTGLLIYQLAI